MQLKSKSDVWALNPKSLPAFIENEANVLRSEDVALISSRIINYMQNIDK
jgi:hypothetical protein